MTYDEWLKKVQEQGAAALQSSIDSSNSVYAQQKQDTQTAYDKAITDTEKSYTDAYRENAVQKLVNERQIAENMANLGLTDSGLNRTQQTAAQLSYANQKGAIDRQKQSAVDTLTSELAAAISSIEQNRATAEQSLRDTAQRNWEAQAVNLYNKQEEEITARNKALLEAETERIKAAQKASASNVFSVLKHSGYDFDTGKMQYYTSNGKLISFAAGKNPYNGNQNAVVTVEDGKVTVDKAWKKNVLANPNASDITKAAATYGVFNNGYQPKGVYGYGKVSSAGKFDAVDGRTGVNVWVTKEQNGTNYWIWDGQKNMYQRVSYDLKTGEIRELN